MSCMLRTHYKVVCVWVIVYPRVAENFSCKNSCISGWNTYAVEHIFRFCGDKPYYAFLSKMTMYLRYSNTCDVWLYELMLCMLGTSLLKSFGPKWLFCLENEIFRCVLFHLSFWLTLLQLVFQCGYRAEQFYAFFGHVFLFHTHVLQNITDICCISVLWLSHFR